MQTMRTMLLKGKKWRFWVKVPSPAEDSRCMVSMVMRDGQVLCWRARR